MLSSSSIEDSPIRYTFRIVLVNECYMQFKFSCYSIGAAPITQYTHVRNENSNTQGNSPNVVKVFFSYLKELLLKERILSP